jgi:hypothetical protein
MTFRGVILAVNHAGAGIPDEGSAEAILGSEDQWRRVVGYTNRTRNARGIGSGRQRPGDTLCVSLYEFFRAPILHRGTAWVPVGFCFRRLAQGNIRLPFAVYIMVPDLGLDVFLNHSPLHGEDGSFNFTLMDLELIPELKSAAQQAGVFFRETLAEKRCTPRPGSGFLSNGTLRSYVSIINCITAWLPIEAAPDVAAGTPGSTLLVEAVVPPGIQNTLEVSASRWYLDGELTDHRLKLYKAETDLLALMHAEESLDHIWIVLAKMVETGSSLGQAMGFHEMRLDAWSKQNDLTTEILNANGLVGIRLRGMLKAAERVLVRLGITNSSAVPVTVDPNRAATNENSVAVTDSTLGPTHKGSTGSPPTPGMEDDDEGGNGDIANLEVVGSQEAMV